MYKKINIILLSLVFLFLILPLTSSAPPQKSETGLYIRTAISNYIEQDEYFDVHAHVFDYTTGIPIETNTDCYLHLYHKNGTHIFTEKDSVSSNMDYAWDIDGGNFSQVGTHQYIIQCNGTYGVDKLGGFISGEFYVNQFGEELTTGRSITFNFAMLFLMVLFVLSLVGLFTFENPSGKLASYWFAHLLFIVGTFSVWTFNAGFSLDYLGLASIYKILFYVSITAVFPMILLSMAWIFYMHLMNDTIKGFMERGIPEDEAYERARRRKKW